MGGTLNSILHFLNYLKVAQIESQQENEMKGVGEQVHTLLIKWNCALRKIWNNAHGDPNIT